MHTLWPGTWRTSRRGRAPDRLGLGTGAGKQDGAWIRPSRCTSDIDGESTHRMPPGALWEGDGAESLAEEQIPDLAKALSPRTWEDISIDPDSTAGQEDAREDPGPGALAKHSAAAGNLVQGSDVVDARLPIDQWIVSGG